VAIDEVKSIMNQKRHYGAPSDRPDSHGVVTANELISAISKAVALKERLGLEYEKVMILALIAARHLRSGGRKERGCNATASEEGLLDWNGSTMSLARHLGIPRETVRRKLVELCDDGWLMPSGQDARYQPSEHLLLTLADVMSRTRSSA
jgi:hypothetical protein